ncbi:hypothetical protein [Marinobacter sp. JSM 1782161]|uniref:hypothetical protein n=1 Tax=Marinobacter sp. JSM 1782161 TaxID=2685906 RepID=UPI0014034D69|nr:hypothetical protein [Marinobacter sp. JSM 1782161]
MRARNIKPGFWKNEDLVDLPYEYRLLFIGLPMLADREGRLEDRPKRIKMELFPADPVDVDDGLNELIDRGFLERYESEGVKVLMISKFAEHQSPHHSEKKSDLPGKDGFAAVKEPEKSSGSPKRGREDTGDKPDSSGEKNEEGEGGNREPTVDLPKDHGEPTVDPQNSGRRNRPDSLIPDSPNPDSLEKTIGTSASDAPTQAELEAEPPEPSGKNTYPEAFELVWRKYPKRPGSNPKNKAFRAWRARVKDGAAPADILAGTVRYANYIRQTNRQNTEFIMQAVRFFGTSCEYENEWTPPEDPGPNSPHNGFGNIDYSAGLKREVRDGEANF